MILLSNIKEDLSINESIKNKILIAEGNIIGCLWKDPSLFGECELNKKELSEDGLFYYTLGERLFKLKHDVFDEMAVLSLLEGNRELKERWDNYGGYKTIKELMNVSNVENIYGYIEMLDKYIVLKKLNQRGFDVSRDWSKFEQMTPTQIIDYVEYELLNIELESSTSDIEFEQLYFTEEEIAEVEQGLYVGLNYSKHCPQLNYLTMGIPKGDLTMFGSYVNGGKSSFVTSNIIIPIAESGIKVHVISNEQRSQVYKFLLAIYVMVNDLNYYKLTRKKLKGGKWSNEEKEMFLKANEIIKSKYPNITFSKTYDYDMQKVCQIIKRQAKRGCELFVYDTMKGDNLTDGSVWQSLIEDSKKLFQTASKEDVAVVVTFQLALHSLQKRFLDLSVLANGKQVSEVFSEIILFRDIFSDEYTGEKEDIHCYQLMRDESTGAYLKDPATGQTMKKEITLTPNKKYKLFFLSKTRNDENGVCLVYEFDGAWNIWKEVGRANVKNIGL